jgi:hypothetical protein
MKKNLFCVFMVLLVCIPAYGMKRALEPEVQGPYGGFEVPREVISRIFALCSTGALNVLMKVCKVYATLAARTNSIALVTGGMRLPELHVMNAVRESLANSNIEQLRAVSTMQDVGVPLQKNIELQRILSWLLLRMQQDRVQLFRSLLPKCVTDHYEGLLQDFPDRDIGKITGPGSRLQMSIVFEPLDNHEWTKRIACLCNACRAAGEEGGTWLRLNASLLLKMAIMCNRTECIKAILGNADYAEFLEPQENMLAQWPDLLYHACASKNTASFQILIDWLCAQPIEAEAEAVLLKQTMTQVIDINRHQYLRIVVAKGRTVKDFDIWAKKRLWHAFVHKKYDSVDTLLEYLSPIVQSQHLPVSESIDRCKRVIEVVFAESMYYIDGVLEYGLQFSLDPLCTKDQQHSIKMILEKFIRFHILMR